MPDYEFEDEQDLCEFFMRGSCKFPENRCGLHEQRLKPGLLRYVDWQASTEERQSCMRCMERQLVCDKSSRANTIDDPCSECRHYGGLGCSCLLADLSLNDVLWRKMISRKAQGYTLPELKPRSQRAQRKGPLNQRMPDARVVLGWQGLSVEDLERQPHLLPDEEHRATGGFPWNQGGRFGTPGTNAGPTLGFKRSISDAFAPFTSAPSLSDSMPAANFPTPLPAPSFARPVHAQYGKASGYFYDYNTGRGTVYFPTSALHPQGVLVTMLAMQVSAPGSGAPAGIRTSGQQVYGPPARRQYLLPDRSNNLEGSPSFATSGFLARKKRRTQLSLSAAIAELDIAPPARSARERGNKFSVLTAAALDDADPPMAESGQDTYVDSDDEMENVVAPQETQVLVPAAPSEMVAEALVGTFVVTPDSAFEEDIVPAGAVGDEGRPAYPVPHANTFEESDEEE
ncbi:hypothetical protein LTR78_007089 [Recurvomyces mirabilis]|uniref:C3H1-type domain-containing protein n=1 Tax=Recurvomyces mirabilis TaxID=574656 RepID=A0AAE1BZ05_9PEZI|nr:hypothetical protein LTR78_007089 [Recurvomyces mirabilis]